jgi:hypothetical protein
MVLDPVADDSSGNILNGPHAPELKRGFEGSKELLRQRNI